MPPGVVSFAVHSGLPPVSYWTRCHLHQLKSALLGTTQSKIIREVCIPPGRRLEFCTSQLNNKVITNRFMWNWNEKRGPLLDLSLVMWLPQPMRTSPSGSVWSLLGQSRCEKQGGGGFRGREGEKGVSSEYQSQIFTLLSFHTHNIPLTQRLWLSLPPLYHELSAHLVFSLFFLPQTLQFTFN